MINFIFSLAASFIFFQLVLTSLSIILSTIVLRVHHTNSAQRAPLLLRALCLGCLARLLCFGNQHKAKGIGIKKEDGVKASLASLKEELDRENEGPSDERSSKLLKYVEVIVQRIREETEGNEIRDEWKKIAWVLDWVFFWLNALAILFACLIIYAKPILELKEISCRTASF